MPVPPSSSRYSSYTSSYPSSYRTPSSSYLGRTTSLDRTPYSSYSGYSSYTSSKVSLPPRPSYSDTYRSSRSNLRQSPVRPYVDPTPSSRYGGSNASIVSGTGSRYSSLRDSSSSRDSGYGSRLTSRDRSVDYVNGNSIDTSHFGPSPSSYACNYRFEVRDKKDENGDEKTEKPNISERIRAFETRDSLVGLPAGRESKYDSKYDSSRESKYESTRDSKYDSSRESKYESTRDSKFDSSRYLTEPSTSSSTRRKVQEILDAHSRSPSAHKSPETRRGKDTDSTDSERRPSVTELRQKYDSNHNFLNGRDSDSESEVRESRRRTDSASDSAVSRKVDSSPVRRVDSPIRKESPVRPGSRNESPLGKRETDRDGRSSPLINGTLDKPKLRVDTDPLDLTSRTTPGAGSRYRRDRVRERVAARLARDNEDDDGPRRHTSSGTSASGVLTENNGLVGLRNIGNTCFMNSVTQCLSNTKCLLEYIVRDGYSSDINTTISTMKGDLVRAFANLLSDMWSEGHDTSRALNTGPFKSQIQRFAPAFSGYQQHDAQEFLRKLLEGLHEDVNRVTAKPTPITHDINDDLDDTQKAMESWKRYLRYDDSKIVDMFVGQLKSCLQCSVCSHSSVTFDPFWDLSLPIPSKSGQVRLTQCLDLFTKEEILDGDERPTCSKCKERRKMSKSFSIQKFPKVLVLHLKRFSPLERWRGKLSCTVEFPLESLDLSKFASSSSSSPLYKLIGVANHSGTTYSGHYTAYCKHPYSHMWHEYNDSRVSSISPGRVCSPEAYVLFYEISSSSSSSKL